MKVSCEIACPGCKIGKPKIQFKKPSLCVPTMTIFDCPECASTIRVKLTRLPGTPPSQVNIKTYVMQPSPMLLAMLAEEAEHNEKPHQESEETPNR